MADILIRGMEMPRNCGARYLNHGEFCFMLCRKLNLPQEWEARPSNCPLVELPEHGDLVDRDALVEEQKLSRDYHAQNSREESLLERAIRIVREAPVVVPADKEESK